MKIAVLCNRAVLLPALEALYSQGLLAGVATPEAIAAGNRREYSACSQGTGWDND